MTSTLPSFPVDEGTLAVILDSLDSAFVGNDAQHEPIRAEGALHLQDVLHLLSGYQPSDSVAAIFSTHDVIRALITEIQQLRAKVRAVEALNDMIQSCVIRRPASIRRHLAAALDAPDCASLQAKEGAE